MDDFFAGDDVGIEGDETGDTSGAEGDSDVDMHETSEGSDDSQEEDDENEDEEGEEVMEEEEEVMEEGVMEEEVKEEEVKKEEVKKEEEVKKAEEEEYCADDAQCLAFATAYASTETDSQNEQQIKRVLRVEWNNLDQEGQEALGKCIGYILQSGTQEAKQKARDLKVKIQQAATDDARRLHLLDSYDDALNAACKAYGRTVETVDNFQKFHRDTTGSTFLASLYSCAKNAMARQEAIRGEQLRAQSEELYPLKRLTPGRKVRCQCPSTTSKRLLPILADLAKVIPQMPKIVPLPRDRDVVWKATPDLNIGGGNQGVFVQIGVDASQRIVDRRVRKDIELGDPVFSPELWRGDTAGDTAAGVESETLLPQEYVAQRLMSRPDAQFVVNIVRKLDFNEKRNETMMASIYMEYANHGDLATVLHLHKKKNVCIPVEFLWLVFHALVDTVFIMKYGSLDEDDSPDDWLEIVHRDLKPANIFLSSKSPNHFNMFPRPKVADYGLAVLTHEEDKCNPYMYGDAGTEGYLAPEQLLFRDPVKKKWVDDMDMLSPCNVWAIGAIMYDLMTLQNLEDPGLESGDAEQLPYCVDASGPTGKEFEFDVKADVAAKWTVNPYPKAMIDMVQKCVRFETWNRISIEELKESVDTLFEEDEHLNKLAKGQPVDPPSGRLRHDRVKELWEMGRTFQ